MIGDWFDKYSLQARLAPALLALFPALLLAATKFPTMYQTAAGLVGLLTVCGVLTVFSHFARTRGKQVEKKLNMRWGARPTTLMLLNHDGTLDKTTHSRYLKFFEDNIPGWTLSENRRESYESAVRWLLERTRDTSAFGLIFKENVSYGFRRNTLGMKPIALVISLACTAYWLIQIYAAYNAQSVFDPIDLAAGIATAMLLIWWLAVVGESWVREAGDAYAKALLGATDKLSG